MGITAALDDVEPDVGGADGAETTLDSGTKAVAESVPVGSTVLVWGTDEVRRASGGTSEVVVGTSGGGVVVGGGSVVVGRSGGGVVVTGGGVDVLFAVSGKSVGGIVGVVVMSVGGVVGSSVGGVVGVSVGVVGVSVGGVVGVSVGGVVGVSVGGVVGGSVNGVVVVGGLVGSESSSLIEVVLLVDPETVLVGGAVGSESVSSVSSESVAEALAEALVVVTAGPELLVVSESVPEVMTASSGSLVDDETKAGSVVEAESEVAVPLIIVLWPMVMPLSPEPEVVRELLLDGSAVSVFKLSGIVLVEVVVASVLAGELSEVVLSPVTRSDTISPTVDTRSPKPKSLLDELEVVVVELSLPVTCLLTARGK